MLHPEHNAASATASSYPDTAAGRDRWILERRGSRREVDAAKPYAFLVEPERSASGEVVSVATVLLTNRECPWRCLMCDLWQNTLAASVPPGAIPAQIDFALSQLPVARQIKLYNSGSFFDARAIPVEDHPAIAERVRRFERVIVECHPALVGESAVRFRDQLASGGRTVPVLEVAMGLETIHPEVLPRLNKRMTPEMFAGAAEFLRRYGIALRVFVLVKPPFLEEGEAVEWAQRSAAFAFECGATAVTLIPTRLGNGAMEELVRRGEFAPPRLETFEAAVDAVLGEARCRVFADTWDLERFSNCPECFARRKERLECINLSQAGEARIHCATCGTLTARS